MSTSAQLYDECRKVFATSRPDMVHRDTTISYHVCTRNNRGHRVLIRYHEGPASDTSRFTISRYPSSRDPRIVTLDTRKQIVKEHSDDSLDDLLPELLDELRGAVPYPSYDLLFRYSVEGAPTAVVTFSPAYEPQLWVAPGSPVPPELRDLAPETVWALLDADKIRPFTRSEYRGQAYAWFETYNGDTYPILNRDTAPTPDTSAYLILHHSTGWTTRVFCSAGDGTGQPVDVSLHHHEMLRNLPDEPWRILNPAYPPAVGTPQLP